MFKKPSYSTFDTYTQSPLMALSHTPSMPNPNNYYIQWHFQANNYLIVMMNYSDCTNYEGNKILMFKGITIDMLKNQKVIDPHFSRNLKFYSPIARFEPTLEGWSMAVKFVKSL